MIVDAVQDDIELGVGAGSVIGRFGLLQAFQNIHGHMRRCLHGVSPPNIIGAAHSEFRRLALNGLRESSVPL